MYKYFEEDDLECLEDPNEDAGDLVAFGLTIINNTGLRMESISHLRPKGEEDEDEFLSRLHSSGESDEYFATACGVGEVEILIGRSLRG